ncbi:MAG: hypothetical protein J5I59_09795, partial [Saprospiraceae bacterium]|nr:hypothetical protein [Saprospiraceae bacterium]
MKHLFFILLTLASYFSIQAQLVEFDTYFAFEDAAGRRDTVWYGARLDATYGFDPKYEELVKQPIDSTTFVVLSSGFDPALFFNKKYYVRGELPYTVNVMFTFIDAAYPIHAKMNTDFVQNLNWSELFYYKYISTWCQDPHLLHPWNDSTSVFDCIDIQTGEFVINEPPSTDPVESYCETSSTLSNINIKGKGEVTLNAFAILTFLDQYCKLTGSGNSTLKRLGDDAIVYPNPSNGSFEIKTLWQSGLLRIFDYRGQTVKKVI